MILEMLWINLLHCRKNQLHARKVSENVGRFGIVGPKDNHPFALSLAELLGLQLQILPNRGQRNEACSALLEDAVNILIRIAVAHHLGWLAEF